MFRLQRIKAFLLCGALAALSCGKKGDPQPPLPRGPRAVSDVAVEQEAADAVVTFTYPDRLMTGQPLTDLESIAIYRAIDPPPALTTPATAPPGARTDEAPAAGARRAAAAARMAQESFLRESQRVAVLPLAALARHTRGATLVYRDSLTPLYEKPPGPTTVAYAVVSVRRNGEKSPLSNIALLAPAVPAGAPVLLAVTPEEGRICLEWLPPETNLYGGKLVVGVGGYFIYRRALPDEEYGAPLNAAPVPGTSYVDTSAPYGSKLVYTLRATLANKPKVEGAPSEEAGVDYRDVFPPPAPARLDALPEKGLVRLVWDPVAAPDLAGYAVFRAEGDGAPARWNKELIKESFTADETAQAGHRYRYTVRAVDASGNMSPPSPEAVAEPF